MIRQSYWIADDVNAVDEWCNDNLEYSYCTLIYGGRILAFYPREEGEEMLFRIKWAHNIAW